MKGTELLLELIKEYPQATNAEYAELSKGKLTTKYVSIYLKRFEKKGEIVIAEHDGNRYIKKAEKTPLTSEKAIRKEFKDDIFEQMIEIFFDDFLTGTSVEQRLEIGKIILKIADKL